MYESVCTWVNGTVTVKGFVSSEKEVKRSISMFTRGKKL